MVAPIQVCLADMGGSATELEMEQGSLTKALKRRIKEILHVAVEEQILTAGEAILMDVEPLELYAVDGVVRLLLVRRQLLELLVTVCWTGMCGGPETVLCRFPVSLNFHDICCAALGERGGGTFGCRIFVGPKGSRRSVPIEGLTQPIGEALNDGAELYINWFGDEANSDDSVTIKPSVGMHQSLASFFCACDPSEGYIHVKMSGYRCGFRGVFPSDACVGDVLASALYHQPEYKGSRGGQLLQVQENDKLADLCDVTGNVLLQVRAGRPKAIRERWRVFCVRPEDEAGVE
eukprot:TRINITY_DN11015_c0_g1_i1.p1 TRINITY_DN11015_c0_g1~~TRINITY_DN11015_c0_g1_i1.p1  ORF type:complete len:291 (-),score=29.46 TRINITY_DN11015_c0_g1_i1:100-972(-)